MNLTAFQGGIIEYLKTKDADGNCFLGIISAMWVVVFCLMKCKILNKIQMH